jgi:hypothetical protein
VAAGWSRISQRPRLVARVMTAHATSTDQATWTDGMADSWSAPAVEPTAPYTDWPYWAARSVMPAPVSRRGGATGMKEMTRQIAVLAAIALRTAG